MSNSITRLAALPDVFHATDVLLRCQVPKEQLNQMMWRWKKAGYVQALGDRADVWFNLITDKNITRDRWERALRIAMPSAIAAGHSVLMRSGLTTQMTSKDYLIRPARSTTCTVGGAEVHERSAVWINHLHQAGAVHHPDRAFSLGSLAPGAALLDMLAFDAENIDPDEIYWDELSRDCIALYEKLLPKAEHLSGQALPQCRSVDAGEQSLPSRPTRERFR